MVRFFIFYFIFFSSCMRYNEYGIYRVGLSKFTITPNSDSRAYTIIDTNVVYRFVKDERVNISGAGIPRYYKFYSNGRVAEFHDRNINVKKESILDAKKGYMGFYNLQNNNFVIQFYNNNANASELFVQNIKATNDTLIMTYNGIENSSIKSFFIKEELPMFTKITKPDW